MKGSDAFDRIMTSTPVNRSAALAVSGKGEHFEPKVKIACEHHDIPPKTVPVPTNIAEDLTGRKWGRMTVVGYLRSSTNNTGGAVWLARCACGAYETRRTKPIKNASPRDRCTKCNALRSIRRRQHFDAYGRWPDD